MEAVTTQTKHNRFAKIANRHNNHVEREIWCSRHERVAFGRDVALAWGKLCEYSEDLALDCVFC